MADESLTWDLSLDADVSGGAKMDAAINNTIGIDNQFFRRSKTYDLFANTDT